MSVIGDMIHHEVEVVHSRCSHCTACPTMCLIVSSILEKITDSSKKLIVVWFAVSLLFLAARTHFQFFLGFSFSVLTIIAEDTLVIFLDVHKLSSFI